MNLLKPHYTEWKVRENLLDLSQRNTYIIYIMNEHRQNEEIALYCGWKFDMNQYKQWISPDGTSWNYPPAYTKDLNQMYKAENALTEDQWETYTYTLINVCTKENPKTTDRPLRPAPNSAQKAEAFLKTIGKWEE